MQMCCSHLLETLPTDALNALKGHVIGLPGVLPDIQVLSPFSIHPALLPALPADTLPLPLLRKSAPCLHQVTWQPEILLWAL